jgi:hypothetical protein
VQLAFAHGAQRPTHDRGAGRGARGARGEA